jgi:hypothetical protein
MSEGPDDKPKIIVDDDWKSRAQAEKEQLQKEAEAKKEPDGETAAADQAGGPLPPASFAVLVTTLATQALAMLGQIPDPEGKPTLQLDHAKHFIDTLGVLEEKTKGNLTSDESAMLTNVLHELRMIFVTVGNQQSAQPADGEQAAD